MMYGNTVLQLPGTVLFLALFLNVHGFVRTLHHHRHYHHCNVRPTVTFDSTMTTTKPLWMTTFTPTTAFNLATDTTAEPLESLTRQCQQRALQQHEAEFHAGTQIFGSTTKNDLPTKTDPTCTVQTFTDADFRTYDIGRNNFGPISSSSSSSATTATTTTTTTSATALKDNCHVVFETTQPVLTGDDCEFLIDAARRAIAKERSQVDATTTDATSDRTLTNSDLGEARLSALDAGALQHLRHLLQTRLYPVLQSRFGTEQEFTLYDGLILGTIAPSKSQPVHRDASLLTLNIPLSAPHQFTGGGTYVEPLDCGFAAPIVMEQGHALCHLSGVRHAGTAITTGQRWVLVMFLLARDEPQIARRSHAAGLEALHTGDLHLAMACFQAGLQVNPKDHLLLLGMGSIASRQGNTRLAYRYLHQACASYPLDRKAVLAKGNMLLAQRRPRAALRQLEQLLETDIAGRDAATTATTTTWMPLKALAWEARMRAAQASLLCAERAHPSWMVARLPQAIAWLQTALIPAPQDPRLHGLLARAEQMLAAAKREA